MASDCLIGSAGSYKEGKRTNTVSTMFSTYYDRIIGNRSASFANLAQTGEQIEDGLKTEKFMDYYTLFEQSSSGTRGSTKKCFSTQKVEKGEKEVHSFQGRRPDINNSMVILLPFIIYLHRLLYFRYTPTMPCIRYQRYTIPTIKIRKVSHLRKIRVLLHH